MVESVPQSRSPLPIKAFLLAAIAVTLGDAADGVIFFWLTAGLNPITVLQYIASGLIGRAAFQGGLETAFLGLAIHTFLAFTFTALLFVALARSSMLGKYWAVSGLVWGALVYLFMNFVALPHSNVAPSPISAAAFINGIVSHALLVGFVPAYFARTRTASNAR